MADVAGQLMALPLPQLVAVGAAFLLASMLVSSFLFRTLLRPKNSPPYIGCLPVIGGISKFIKVWIARSPRGCQGRKNRFGEGSAGRR